MAEALAKKYNIDTNEYTKIATPKYNSCKRHLVNTACLMCGCLFFKRGNNWYILGKHSQLALDCYYYLCSLIPKEHRKDSKFIYGFVCALQERLQSEPGWINRKSEVEQIAEALGGQKSGTKDIIISQEGYDHGKKVSLRRQADSRTKLLEHK